MPDNKRPHLAWTAAVVAVLALLFSAAWWLWSQSDTAGNNSPDSSTSPTAGGGGTEDSTPTENEPSAAEDTGTDARLQAALDGVRESLQSARFRAATEALTSAEDEFGWSNALGELSTRLSLREAGYRQALRPIEFRIESLATSAPADDTGALFARFSIEGVPVFASEFLEVAAEDDSAASTGLPGRGHLAVLRTSFAVGASLEIVEPGSLFGSEDVIFGPVPLSPLPITEGGRFEFSDTGGRVHSLVVRYQASAFEPGVHFDAPPEAPAPGASANHLVDAITAALAQDELKIAALLQTRLADEYPSHEDANWITSRIEARSEQLAQNRTTATFTLIELCVDPRPSGDNDTAMWADGGAGPSFYASIRTTDDFVLADTDGEAAAPFLIPENPEALPGNRLEVTARGEAPLVLLVKDTSPRFSSRTVGTVDLPITLAQLPRGTGTIVIERNPRVLIQPNSEANRIRRVVLRWKVTR